MLQAPKVDTKKAAPAKKGAVKAEAQPNPMFPSRPRSQRVGGDIRVSM